MERVPLLSPAAAAPPPGRASGTESLSYEAPTNRLRTLQRKFQGRRHVYGYTGHTAVSRVCTLLGGVLIGITAVALQQSIERLVALRNGLLQHLFLSRRLAQALGAWVGISAGAVAFSGLLVQVFAPKAAGAGVTLVMAFLNGNDIQGLLSAPVFCIKFLGLVCSRVAALAVGPEGPMVHLGACIASMLSFCEPWFLNRMQANEGGGAGKPTQQAGGAPATAGGGSGGADEEEKERRPRAVFKNTDHREMVSAGAAAGIAAAFGAPIGGVLFSLEEAATHWSRKVGWRCFLCTTAASFTLAQLHPRSQSGMLSFKADTPLTNQQWLIQMPFVILISALGGLLGAAFNVLRKRLWPLRASRKRTVLRLLEAAGTAVATVGVMAGLSMTVGRCLPLPQTWDAAQPFRLTCPEGQYNDLATAYLSSDVWVLRSFFNLGSETQPIGESCGLWSPCYFSWTSLATLSASYLVLMALASSLCVPGGLFLPSIMVGGSFGALFGFALLQVLPPSWDVQPGVYALLCATAVLGGVFRSTFSLVVIVVEGTRGIDFLTGIIVSILVSNLVASRVLSDGVYESELERDGNVYYLRPEAPNPLRSKTADDIMATPVVGMGALVPVAGVRQLLATSTHSGFPVYSTTEPRDPDTGMGRLDGFVLRSQLEVLLRRRAFVNEAGEYVRPPRDLAGWLARLNEEMRSAQATTAMGRVAWERQGAGGCWGPGASSVHGSERERWAPPLVGGKEAAAADGPLGGRSGGGLRRIRTTSASSAAPVDGTAATGAALNGSGPLRAIDSGESRLQGLPPGDPLSSRGGPLNAAGSAGSLRGQPSDGLEGGGCGSPGGEAGLYLSLAPFLDRAPLVVRPQTLGTTVHHLFLAMSLRHLCVVDPRNHVVGIITRKDLDHAAGEGWWRMNHIAPNPHHSLAHQRSGSWLALSLGAPRRLLSSIQAALSPITSPLSSRRGTPKGTPRASPGGTPRASDVEQGGSPFWQPASAWLAAEQAEAQRAAAAAAGTGDSSGSTVAVAAAAAAVTAAAAAALPPAGGTPAGGTPAPAAAHVQGEDGQHHHWQPAAAWFPAGQQAAAASGGGSMGGRSPALAGTPAAAATGAGAAAAVAAAPGQAGAMPQAAAMLADVAQERAGKEEGSSGAQPGLPPPTEGSPGPLGARPPLGRVSPRRRSQERQRPPSPPHPLLAYPGGGGPGHAGSAAGGPPYGGPPPFLLDAAGAMATIAENAAEQGGEQAQPGDSQHHPPPVPRWAAALSGRSSMSLQAFGSIAFHEEAEPPAEHDGGTGQQQQG